MRSTSFRRAQGCDGGLVPGGHHIDHLAALGPVKRRRHDARTPASPDDPYAHSPSQVVRCITMSPATTAPGHQPRRRLVDWEAVEIGIEDLDV